MLTTDASTTTATAPTVASKTATQPALPTAAPVKARRVTKPRAAPVKVLKTKAAVSAPPKVKAKAVAKPKSEKPAKVKKPKLVRDSFTIPKAEYIVLEDLKQRAGKLSSSVKKSEFIRAGIKALAAMSDQAFLIALKAVPAIKTGRPSKANTE